MQAKQIRTLSYDRKFDDIFALQDDITLSVVGAIEPPPSLPGLY
jgi:TolB-like protein